MAIVLNNFFNDYNCSHYKNHAIYLFYVYNTFFILCKYVIDIKKKFA